MFNVLGLTAHGRKGAKTLRFTKIAYFWMVQPPASSGFCASPGFSSAKSRQLFAPIPP
jgi:hypothetical protein